MGRFSTEHLLRLPVRLRGIDVGYVVDLLLDPQARRVLGVEVLCKDDEHRFLPLSAAQLDGDEIAVSSALAMLTANELDFYRKRGSTIRMLRGASVLRAGAQVGHLEDAVVNPDGSIAELVLKSRERLRFEDAITISVEPRRSTAA